MERLVRWHKFTWRVAFTVLVVLGIFFISKPRIGSPFFISGLVLIVLGALLRIWAAGHLSKNKTLTTTGPYAYCKNPLYLGTFLVGSGICLLAEGQYYLSFAALGFFVIIFIVYYAKKKKTIESARLRAIFNEEWDDYDKAVPDYIPRLAPYKKKTQQWSINNLIDNSEHWTSLLIIAIALGITLKEYILLIYR